MGKALLKCVELLKGGGLGLSVVASVSLLLGWSAEGYTGVTRTEKSATIVSVAPFLYII